MLICSKLEEIYEKTCRRQYVEGGMEVMTGDCCSDVTFCSIYYVLGSC